MSQREIHYCLSYPLVLTRRCANVCGYCRFPLSPPQPLPSPKRLRAQIAKAIRAGAVQLEIISGEGLDNLNDVKSTLRFYGCKSYAHYLADFLKLIEEAPTPYPLFPLLNVGNLSRPELELLRPHLCAVQLLLESIDPALQASGAHRQAAAKEPERRLETILNCGRLSIPLSTGMMLGIGERDTSHLRLCEIISRVHQRYGHIQSFEIQTFWPKPDTPMGTLPPVSKDDLLNAVMLARDLLPPDIPIVVKAQEHPHLIEDLLQLGTGDLGSISVRRYPRASQADWRTLLQDADQACRKSNATLRPRLPIHSPFFNKRYYPSGYPQRIKTALDNLAHFTTEAVRS